MRNVELTKKRLIKASGEILATQGFTKFGINAVARKAGVNKALIYRYFGDMDGLVTAYASESDFWPAIDELLENIKNQNMPLNMEQQIRQILLNYWHALERRPETLAVMAWEIVERNQLTAILEEHREKSSMLLGQHIYQQLIRGDYVVDHNIQQKLPSLMAITGASIHYLLLRKRQIRWYVGIDLHNQNEIEKTLTDMAQMIFSNVNSG
jgi:AcrR family transcriptional regulator